MYLDWKEQPRDVFLVDIEADSLTPSVIWCMCWMNLKTGETGERVGHDDIRHFFKETYGSIFVGHNALSFDIPVLNSLLGLDIPLDDVIDTLILSTLYSPSLSGGHSLGAWGERLGEKKGDFHDFSHFSQTMLEYCRQDVKVNAILFRRLVKTLSGIGFSERSITIQHKFTQIINRQKENGFEFDHHRALNLYAELRSREAGLTDVIRQAFPAPLEVVEHYKQAYKKDGNPTANFLRHSLEYEKIEVQPDGSYLAYDRIEFSVGSPKQRVEKLLGLGWEPEEFTPVTEKGGGGTPKPFDKGKLAPSLERFLEKNPLPEVELIARWMSINGRANMINTWLDNYNEDTGRIHGKLFVADTLRLRHQAPNTANIPAVRTTKAGDVLYGEAGYYTYEARDLWVARSGRVLVGTDAAGLELRMLAHYLNRPDFTDQVVNGDPHQFNADVVGITRPQAKTLIYAIMYGAAAPKIAKTLGVPVKEGAKIRNLFLERLGLKELIEECQYEQKNGRVSLVDGSQVICPSPHAALNYKLQGGGARVMAASAIILKRNIDRYGLDSLKVGDIHDEWQYDVDPDDAIPHAILGEEAIRTAGEYLGLSVPLDGESKIGKTWAETH